MQKIFDEKRIVDKLSDISIKEKNIVDALSGIASKEKTNQDVHEDLIGHYRVCVYTVSYTHLTLPTTVSV